MPGARVVSPELLDELAPDDPRARRSRRDLRRIHVAMGSARILARALHALALPAAPRILELGAGDGTLLLDVARRSPAWRGARLTLLDRVALVDDATRAAYARLGWHVDAETTCVLDWVRARPGAHYDVCIASLFLHHFDAAPLRAILDAVASRSDRFVAVEPRRGRLPRLGSRLVGLIGANAVTRADAVTSVDAGFAGRELTAAWPSAAWDVSERPAWPFAHAFVAARRRGTRVDR